MDRPSLRHTVATLAYRAEKVLRDVPPEFAEFRVSATSRTPLALVAHLGDLIEWGERMTHGVMKWAPVPQASWDAATTRFFGALAALDARLALDSAGSLAADVIFQGPIADSLTHIGQLAMLRGVAGHPVRPESYGRAKIEIGRIGRDQPVERTEFDGDASPQK